MKLSPHFTLEELIKTSIKKDNTPSVQVAVNLGCLARYVLEPLRDLVQRPIVITSGYRSQAVNAAVGGVSNSQHLTGCAADIHVDSEQHGMQLFAAAKKLYYVDQCLFEHNKAGARWLHISFSWNPRKQFIPNYRA